MLPRMSDHHVRAKKSLGQHFLTSPIVPGWMCDAADLRAGDIVLEIGPGTGVLTEVLLSRGATVIALEADTRALAVLHERFTDAVRTGQLHLYHQDVRNLDLAEYPQLKNGTYKVVANIPYYLSGLLFRTMLEAHPQPSTLVYLVQKEVAKRAALAPGEKQSLLALGVAAYGHARYVRSVGRGHFAPPPKVDSAIIAITDISRKNFEHVSESAFFELLHAGFGQKRKQLLGNLSDRYGRARVSEALTACNLPQTVRAEDIDIATWLKLAAKLTS